MYGSRLADPCMLQVLLQCEGMRNLFVQLILEMVS